MYATASRPGLTESGSQIGVDARDRATTTYCPDSIHLRASPPELLPLRAADGDALVIVLDVTPVFLDDLLVRAFHDRVAGAGAELAPLGGALLDLGGQVGLSASLAGRFGLRRRILALLARRALLARLDVGDLAVRA